VAAIGLAYGIAGLGNAAGPLIGGLLTETVGWRQNSAIETATRSHRSFTASVAEVTARRYGSQQADWR